MFFSGNAPSLHQSVVSEHLASLIADIHCSLTPRFVHSIETQSDDLFCRFFIIWSEKAKQSVLILSETTKTRGLKYLHQ
jgi:hypothetical protein